MDDVIEAMEPDDSRTRETTKKHACAICGFATGKHYNFRRHFKVHSDDTSTSQEKFCFCTHFGKQYQTLGGLTMQCRILLYTNEHKNEFCYIQMCTKNVKR